MADPDHRIARQIRAARAYAGLSRQQLADALGVHEKTIGRWETGDWKNQPPPAADDRSHLPALRDPRPMGGGRVPRRAGRDQSS